MFGDLWVAQALPTQMRYLRAFILQSEHEFAAALKDLQILVHEARDPDDGYFLMASVSQVIGDYVGARDACGKISDSFDPLMKGVCLIWLDSLAGKLNSARRRLQDEYFPHVLTSATGQKVYYYSALGDMEVRLGHDQAGADAYQHILQLRPDHSAARSNLIQVLIRLKDVSGLKRLLREDKWEVPDLYIHGIVAKMAKKQAPKNVVQEFEDQMRLTELGAQKMLPDRNVALFNADVLNRPNRALEIAYRNWLIQKEPLDTRLLAELARAQGKMVYLDEIRQFIKDTGYQDFAVSQMVGR
jgi:tetratricopeptide (TPR) repeat protein